MSIYAIGDVQGCYKELQRLLAEIKFNQLRDQLWFTGDLVNRGPQSLEVLRFVKSLGKNAVTVLGNHDLHYLAVEAGVRCSQAGDTLQSILAAPDRKILTDWLRTCPLVYRDKKNNFLMIHAGLSSQWDLKTLLSLNQEITDQLKAPQYQQFLQKLFGNTPVIWSNDLQGIARARVIVNYFTRVRFIAKNGALILENKKEKHYLPWFTTLSPTLKNVKILFGHWAALNGKTNRLNLFGLDTGCCWGNCLTALRLSDLKYFSVQCKNTDGVNNVQS